MTEYLNFLKNFQTTLFSYQDIATIYSKLEVQGHVERLVSLIIEIFSEEHEFTLNELKKYGKDNNQREEDFLEEQYELNSTIFQKNFSLIVQNLADEIGKGFLNKFKQDHSANKRKPFGSLRVDQEFNEDHKFLGLQKHQYKSDMPEIQEEIESTGKISPPKSPAKSRESEQQEAFPPGARNFDLNIEELGQKTKSQEDRSSPWESQREGYSMPPTASTDRLVRPDPMNVGLPVSAPRKKEQAKPVVAKSLNSENLMRSSGEFRRSRDDLKAAINMKENISEQGPGQVQGVVHPRSPSYEKSPMAVNQSKINSTRALSPSNKFVKSPTSSMASSKYSAMGSSNYDPADPNFIDSEFSHTKGLSFSKSERAGFFQHSTAPGPGFYEPDEGLKVVKKKAPVMSFSRSPKFSIFDKALNDSPGAIYYPSHHFVSK